MEIVTVDQYIWEYSTCNQSFKNYWCFEMIHQSKSQWYLAIGTKTSVISEQWYPLGVCKSQVPFGNKYMYINHFLDVTEVTIFTLNL